MGHIDIDKSLHSVSVQIRQAGKLLELHLQVAAIGRRRSFKLLVKEKAAVLVVQGGFYSFDRQLFEGGSVK